MKNKVIFLFILSLISSKGFSQAVDWAHQTSTSSNSNVAHHIGSDLNENVYVTGWDYSGGFILKYDPLGSLLWSRHVQGALFYGGSSDDSGSTYVTGNFFGTVTFGNFILNSTGTETEFFLAKYDSFGNCLWVQQAGTATGKAVKTDHQGNIYITGAFGGSCNFGTTTISQTHTGIADNFLARYNSSGQCVWVSQAIGSASGNNTDIAVNERGDIYIIGNYILPLTFGNNTDSITLTPYGNPIFIAKYNSSGVFKWAKNTSVGYCEGRGVVVDPIGNYYITGWYDHSISLDSLSLSSTSSNCFIAKYDSTGMINWVTQPSCNWGKGYGIAISPSNDLFLTGIFENSPGVYNTLIKLDALGNEKWKQGYTSIGNSDVISHGVFADAAKHIYFTGEFEGTVQFGTFVLNKPFNGPERDAFVIKVIDRDLLTTTIKKNESSYLMNIYPNPTYKIITISITAPNPKQQHILKVSDTLGKTVYTETLKDVSNAFTKQIDLSQLPKGIYFVELQQQGTSTNIKAFPKEVKKIVLQ